MTTKQAEEVAALADKRKKLLSHKGDIEIAIKRTSEPFSSTGGAAGKLLMENVLGIFEPNLKATQDYLNTLLKGCLDDISRVDKELSDMVILPGLAKSIEFFWPTKDVVCESALNDLVDNLKYAMDSHRRMWQPRWGIDFGSIPSTHDEVKKCGYASVGEKGPEMVVPPKGSNAIKKEDLVPAPLIGAIEDLAKVLDNFNNEWAKFSK